MTEEAKLKQYVSIVPSPQQKLIQQAGFNVFIHYGLNTFTGKEWGDGKADPKLFNPSSEDTDQWAAVAKAAGASGIILTAKHHDGFCLWQTDTTKYSVASSPYKNGNGDVVKSAAESCKKYGLKFGVYLSPWDRNSELYGTDAYNDFYIAQLTELFTRYGEIFCLWLDGACGAHMDGRPKQIYDFERIYKVARQLQPNCAISNCGPDVRWVGNEGGFARESEWNVVPKNMQDQKMIADRSQQADDGKNMKKDVSFYADDLGSRQFLRDYDELVWYPSEVDVSIRPGWFFHSRENNMLRSLNNLLYIYYTSCGGNSLLLLNIPPDQRGKIHENDERRMRELGNEIKTAFSKKVEIESILAPAAQEGFCIENLANGGTYSPKEVSDKYSLKIKFKSPKTIDKVTLRENCDFSQRIENYTIYARLEGKRKIVAKGTTVGFNRIALFKKPVLADAVEITIDSCRFQPYLEKLEVYEAGGILPRPPFLRRTKGFFHKIFNIIYENRRNKLNKV